MRQTQSEKAEKEWNKDVILLPSPKVKTVPRNLLRQTLFDVGFVISEFKLKSRVSEKELTSSIKKALSDKMAFILGSPKFLCPRCREGNRQNSYCRGDHWRIAEAFLGTKR